MQQTAFDHPNYRKVSEAEFEWLDRQYPAVEASTDPKSAIEFGCGVGVFTGALRQRGLQVHGLDLRPDNIAEATRRHPDAAFSVLDFDGCSDVDFKRVPMADLGFAFGVLYHLENPLGVLRRMCDRAERVMMISTRTAEGSQNSLVLHRENEGSAHNTRRLVAVPTLAAILTGLQSGGFDYVYRPVDQPSHPQWADQFGNGRRHSLIAYRSAAEKCGWQRMQAPDAMKKWEPLFALQGERAGL